MNKLISKSENRQALIERRKSIKKQGLSKRVLESWMDEDETSVNLDHILQILQNNRNDFETLEIRDTLLVKLQEMAVQTNRGYEWLQAINELIEEYKKLKKYPSYTLYIAKYRCLNQVNNFAPEIESSLSEAINSTKNEQEIIDIYVYVSLYYNFISQYKKAESLLLTCEKLSLKINSDYCLSMTWTYMGVHYYSQFNFDKAKRYLILAIEKSDITSKKADLKTINILLRQLNTCLHYLGRIALVEDDFCRAAEYYIKAENKLNEWRKASNIVEPIGSIAYYHLRMGELLEACRLYTSAEFHYQKSRVMFNEIMVLTGLAQVELALAGLSRNFKIQETQILDAAHKSLRIGYVRGEAMALFSLLKLYIKHLKIVDALKTFYKILRSQEVRNLTNQNHVTFFIINIVVRIIKSIFSNGLNFRLKRNKSIPKMIYRCPCPDPQCKTYKKEDKR